MKNLLITILLISSLFCGKAYAQTTEADSEVVYTIVEQMPIFIGGEDAMNNFIEKNLNYPKGTSNSYSSKTVYVNFVILKNGHIGEISIIRGINESINNEVIRVIKLMDTLWIPGFQNHKAFNVSYNLPVRYTSESRKPEIINGKSVIDKVQNYKQIDDEYYEAGVKSFGENKIEEALQFFKNANKYNPEDVDALYNTATIYIKMNDNKNACEYLMKIKALGKPDGDELYEKYCK